MLKQQLANKKSTWKNLLCLAIVVIGSYPINGWQLLVFSVRKWESLVMYALFVLCGCCLMIL
ncbi:hypothetical protein HanRHA438_Chr11g0489511 [Helianthus annuus]|nr:hypothetical protein HanRHA438_Chr11g0489511 [Helianthus annuus]